MRGKTKIFISYSSDILKRIGCSLLIFILGFVLPACSQRPARTVEHSFYYWRSSFSLSSGDFNYLKALNVNKLYVRFFDVDWNPVIKSPVPVGDVDIETDSLGGMQIVPVVFITNRSLENINDSLIQDLALKIFAKVSEKLALFKKPVIKELQLDCDWTTGTKDKYFGLIKDIEKTASVKNIFVTATIRLHQIKYYRLTGVPPVKRGMLMFYNMTPVSNFMTRNSIYDEQAAKRYLVNFNRYPLKLDVVLPAFSWGVLFRGNKIKALINDISREQIMNSGDFQRVDKTRFRALKDVFFEGQLIKKFDTIRLELITPDITESAAELIAPEIKNDSLTVAIYHFNKELEKNYEIKDIQDCYTAFR